MKKLLFVLAMVLCANSFLFAQKISYNYKPLSSEGCDVTFNVMKQDSSYYIVTAVMSTGMQFLNEPTMKLRTFSGAVLTLPGILLGNGNQSLGIVTGNIVLPYAYNISTAQFSVTPEQFEEIKSGVLKIRLTMAPVDHEKVFKKDKIGRKLYKKYLKVKTQVNEF